MDTPSSTPQHPERCFGLRGSFPSVLCCRRQGVMALHANSVFTLHCETCVWIRVCQGHKAGALVQCRARKLEWSCKAARHLGEVSRDGLNSLGLDQHWPRKQVALDSAFLSTGSKLMSHGGNTPCTGKCRPELGAVSTVCT